MEGGVGTPVRQPDELVREHIGGGSDDRGDGDQHVLLCTSGGRPAGPELFEQEPCGRGLDIEAPRRAGLPAPHKCYLLVSAVFDTAYPQKPLNYTFIRFVFRFETVDFRVR